MTGAEIIKWFDRLNNNAASNWTQLWQECADWAWPTNDNINQIRVGGQEKPSQRMIDTCIEANFNFASGFFSNMFPPNVVWAKFRHPDPEIMESQAVVDYFEKVSKIIHNLLLSSNFSQEEFQAMLSMGCFGTNCLSIEEDDKNVFRFRNFIINKIVIDDNYLGEVDTVGRELSLTARQAIQQFGQEKLEKAGLDKIAEDAKAMTDKMYKFVHIVMPRTDYEVGSKKATDKPFASYYVSRETKEVVKESGFDFNPYKVGRFTTGNDEVYGRGPMSMVLATARRTNVIFRSAILSAEQHSNPQWLIPDDDSVRGLTGRSGALIKWRTSNPNGRPERLSPNGDPGIAMDMFKLHDDQIKRMFFNHLFRPLDDYRNMTAYEANVRETTDMMSLTAFVSRYLDEHVSPLMADAYYIAKKAGVLPEAPEELDVDPSYEIDYIGRLSLASKGMEARGSVDTLRIMGELTAGIPQLAQSFDYIDADKLLKGLMYANSGNMRILKDSEVVNEERQIREKQAAQQQQIENAPALADAAQKVSGEIQPNSILAQMGGQGG